MPRIALVLGGGGLKGFAHIGVMRALRERGIRPSLYAGSSIGALLGAAAASGVAANEMAWRAEQLRRRDLFRINHYGMIVDRMRSASLYLPDPLRRLIEQVVPVGTFEETNIPMLVNSVDLARGTQVVWGLPGLRDVQVRDAVYASCALPGFFPPGDVGGRVCVDGGTIDNLPVSVAALGTVGPRLDAIIAVDVGNADLTHEETIHEQGFASIFMRAASVMMHSLQEVPLRQWSGPPMLLIRPRVSHIGWFNFGHVPELVEAGYRAAIDALSHMSELLCAPGGIFPRRTVRVAVDRERCTGCGTCVALAPQTMALDAARKAYALTHDFSWSPADGDFVKHCPTAAISVTVERPPRALVPDRAGDGAPPPRVFAPTEEFPTPIMGTPAARRVGAAEG
jgi:NTE family protein